MHIGTLGKTFSHFSMQMQCIFVIFVGVAFFKYFNPIGQQFLFDILPDMQYEDNEDSIFTLSNLVINSGTW